jgi:hypothetical protein
MPLRCMLQMYMAIRWYINMQYICTQISLRAYIGAQLQKEATF